MIDKFAKRDSCLYCEKQMEAVYRNKKFCSDKCRTYWNRENKKDTSKDIAPVITEPKLPPIPVEKIEVKKAEKKQVKNDVENDVKKTTKNEAPDPSNKVAFIRWQRDNK